MSSAYSPTLRKQAVYAVSRLGTSYLPVSDGYRSKQIHFHLPSDRILSITVTGKTSNLETAYTLKLFKKEDFGHQIDDIKIPTYAELWVALRIMKENMARLK